MFSFLLVSGDLFTRFPILLTFNAAFWVFIYMFPLMASFAFPIASCLAIQLTINKLHISSQIYFFLFFEKAYKMLQKSIWIFAISIVLMYLPFVLFWAPQSYNRAKNFILNYAKEKFYELDAGRVHNISPQLNIFFEKKENLANQAIKFENVFVRFNNMKQHLYLAANNIIMNEGHFILNEGEFGSIKNGYYLSVFKEAQFALEDLFLKEKVENTENPKFLSWEDLLDKICNTHSLKFLWEMHRRLAFLLWQLILPFLAFILMFYCGGMQGGLFLSVFFTAFLFMLLYVGTNLSFLLASLVGKTFMWMLFYFLPIFVFCFTCFFCRKKNKG